MSRKNMITLAVVLVVGYLIYNMSRKPKQQSTQGGNGQPPQQNRRFR